MKTNIECTFMIRTHLILLKIRNVSEKRLIACLAVDSSM